MSRLRIFARQGISLLTTEARLQILKWLEGSEQPPLVVLDECHKAKNLVAGGKGASPACHIYSLITQVKHNGAPYIHMHYIWAGACMASFVACFDFVLMYLCVK